MTLTLPPEMEQFLVEQVTRGKYSSPRDVVCAALRLLEQQMAAADDFEPGEWDHLLAQAEAEGEPMEFDDAVMNLRAERTAAKAKALK